MTKLLIILTLLMGVAQASEFDPPACDFIPEMDLRLNPSKPLRHLFDIYSINEQGFKGDRLLSLEVDSFGNCKLVEPKLILPDLSTSTLDKGATTPPHQMSKRNRVIFNTLGTTFIASNITDLATTEYGIAKYPNHISEGNPNPLAQFTAGRVGMKIVFTGGVIILTNKLIKSDDKWMRRMAWGLRILGTAAYSYVSVRNYNMIQEYSH